MLQKATLTLLIAVLSLTSGLYTIEAYAKDKSKKQVTHYTEEDFLRTFSGKMNTVVTEKLGAPHRKEVSVKPTNANMMLAGKGQESSKPVNVEMWYYNGLVDYAPNKAYKFTEMTFVNGRCMNIAFFNNK